MDGAAKAKKMESKLPNWLIERIEKCNVSPLSPMLGRMYNIEHRVYSPVPSITNHKAVRHQITKHGRRNHHFTLRWLRFSIVFFEKPPHRTKLDGRCYCVLRSSTSTFMRPLVQRTSWMQIRRLSRLAGDTCVRWSPSTVFSVECTLSNHNVRDIVDVTAMGKEVK